MAFNKVKCKLRMTIDNTIRYNNLDYTKSLTITAPIEHTTPSRFVSFPRIFPSVLSAELQKCITALCTFDNAGLEIAPVSGAFANKDFAFATKISPLVAILRPSTTIYGPKEVVKDMLIFNVDVWPTRSSDLMDYGRQEIQRLTNWFKVGKF